MEKAMDEADPIIRVMGLPVCACADERPPWKKVQSSLMPQGVEHAYGGPKHHSVSTVQPSLMPQGVEHFVTVWATVAAAIVRPSLMPQGVEHYDGWNYNVIQHCAPLFDAARR